MATRSVEEWARSVIAAELGVAVEIHDDGSQPRMYELGIGSVLRLAGSVLLEVHDEWQVSDRRYLSEASMAKL